MPVAVITGGSRGLGAAFAHGLAERGWTIVADARHAEALSAAVPGGAHRAIPGDVTDPRHRQDLATAAEALGGADLFVANASTLGASPLPRFADLDPATYSHVLQVNVVAPVALVRDLLPQLRKTKGRVIAISSDAAVEPYATWGAYGSSKAALDHAARVLAEEEPQLRVYAVDPGDMRTRMQQDAFPGKDISDRAEPATVVPHLLSLVEGDLPSGRYRASDIPLTGAATTRESA